MENSGGLIKTANSTVSEINNNEYYGMRLDRKWQKNILIFPTVLLRERMLGSKGMIKI